MGKRTSTTTASPQKGKAAKTAASPRKSLGSSSAAEKLASALQEPFAEACAKQFTGETAGSVENTVEMLCTALPFAVASAKAERHPYQMTIIAQIEQAIAEAEQIRQKDLDAKAAEIEQHASDGKSAAGNLEEAKNRAAASKEAKEQKAAAEKEAGDAVEAAKVKVTETQAQLEARGAERQKSQSEQSEYETLRTDAWAKLTAGDFEKKAWRERNKVAGNVLKMLEKIGMPKALGAALEVVLKTRPEDRGPFALKTLEHGEQLFVAHAAARTQDIETCDAAIEEGKVAVEAAEKALKEADEQKSAAVDELINADNAWASEETRVYEIGEMVRNLEPRANALEEEHADKKDRLESLQGLKVSWNALLDPQTEVADVQKEEAEPMAVESTTKENEPI